MKKSQMLGMPTIYIMFTFIAVLVVVFGAFSIKHVNKANREAQLTNFVLSLQNKLKGNAANVGGVKGETFAVPMDMEAVCFVDKPEKFSPFSNKKLTEKMLVFREHNVFIEPFDDYSPRKASYLLLSEDENPLCVRTDNGKLRLILKGAGNATIVSAAEEDKKESECISIVYNNEPEKSIDIVFLGYMYKNTDDFAADVNKYVNEIFFETEPFSSNKDKINFYRVDNFNLNCKVGSWISCRQYETKQIASNCPNDYIIVLVDRNVLADVVNPVRSSAVANIAKINTADNMFVFMHELGHSIGGLADEYVDPHYGGAGFKVDSYPNCGTKCKWFTIAGGGCFGGLPADDNDGCSVDTAHRGTETSLMKELRIHEYGPVNEVFINRILDKYGDESE